MFTVKTNSCKDMLKNIKICRTCCKTNLKLYEFNQNTDFHINISEMLSTILPQLFIEPDLPLPQQICNNCLEDLKVCYTFRKQCLQMHEVLRKRMAHPVNTIMVTKPEIETGNIKEIESDNEDHLDVVNNDSDIEESTERSTLLQYEAEKTNNGNVDNFITVTDWRAENSETSFGSDDESSQNLDKKSSSNTKIKPERSIKTEPSSNSNTLKSIHCPECNKQFRRQYQLKLHQKMHLSSNQHVCLLCNYRFETLTQLNDHETQHKQQGSFKCSECERVFEKKAFLASHRLLQHNAIKEFTCDICKLSFKTNLCYSKHKINKHPEEVEENEAAKISRAEKKNQCHLCDKSFHRAIRLREHLLTHTGEKPLKCPKCLKLFRGRSALRQHILRHQGKTIECTDCPMKFHQVSELKKHMTTHSILKPFQCDVCLTRFNRSDSLKDHKRIHEGYKPYKCEECSKTFIRKKSLEIHMVTHTGARPYKCKFCERDYTAQGDLNKHLRIHLGENIYTCDECPKTFKYSAELRHHKSEHFKEKKLKTITLEHQQNNSCSATVQHIEEDMFT